MDNPKPTCPYGHELTVVDETHYRNYTDGWCETCQQLWRMYDGGKDVRMVPIPPRDDEPPITFPLFKEGE